MPYKTLQEAKDAGFPTSAEDVDLTIAQVNKLAELYDAVKAAGSADNPMAVAWTAWKRLYKKEGSKWVEREREQAKQMQFLTNAEHLKVVGHDAIIQTLDRWMVRTDDTGKQRKVCYSRSAFEETVDNWNGVPVIYATTHPDMDLFAADPEAALKKIKGRIVGTASNARIDTVGHPRLMGTLDIKDNEVNDLTGQGKISVSSGFYGSDEDGRVTGVIPQHILLFPETVVTQPVDQGSQILNMTNKDGTEEVENAGRAISEANATELSGMIERLQAFLKRLLQGGKSPVEHEKEREEKGQKEVENMGEDEKKEIESLRNEIAVANSKIIELATEKDAKIAELTKSIADRDEQITNMKEKLKAYNDAQAAALKAAQDTEFEALLNAHVPKGLYAKDEQKLELRKEFDADPHAFVLKVLNMTKAPGTPREGQPFEHADASESVRSVGTWNATKKAFEPIKGGN